MFTVFIVDWKPYSPKCRYLKIGTIKLGLFCGENVCLIFPFLTVDYCTTTRTALVRDNNQVDRNQISKKKEESKLL